MKRLNITDAELQRVANRCQTDGGKPHIEVGKKWLLTLIEWVRETHKAQSAAQQGNGE